MACLRAVLHPRRAGHPQCSVPDDVSPAGDAARRTPDGRGPWQRWRHSQRAVSLRANGGCPSLAQPPHCKSASVQDWHLKCRRVGLPATQSIARDSAFPSLVVASCVPQSLSSLVITTSPPSALMSGTCARRRTIFTVRKRSERASCSTSWPTVEPAAVWANQSPGLRSCSIMVITQAVTGFTKACAASSSEEIARYGYDPFRWAHDEFTPRTPDVQKNDARARCRTCNARSKRLDDTDTLDAGTGWQCRLTTEAAAHDVHVARMNRRKSHADENFTWAGFRFGQFSYGEDVVGVAGAFKNKCFHKCSPSVVVSLR